MAGGSTATGVRAPSAVTATYDVEAVAALPELTGLPGVATVTSHELELEAVLFDTADLRLRAAGIVLRSSTGGPDDGWHLVLPAGTAREVVTVVAEPRHVPPELAALVRSRARGQALVPVASLMTRRLARRLLSPGGTVLAEVVDDRVLARRLPTGCELEWRQWQVERLDGDEDLLRAVHLHLAEAGAALSGAASGLDRVLPRPPATQDTAWWETGRRRRRRPSAGTAVQAHLAQQVAELVARDPHTRRNRPDALHRMRVATRRLRSALATFRPLLEHERTDPLRDELRWLAAVLGAARDAEVLHERLRRLVAAEPDDLVLGAVRERIDVVMSERHRAAHDVVLEELDGARYLRLLDALDALVADPPFLRAAGHDAATALPPLVRRTWRRLDRAMSAAERAPRGPEQDELLHEVRKQAKRTRYAAEAVQPVVGRPARRYAAAVAELQETLGAFQDGVVTRQLLRELGARGHRAGENAFTLGRLHAQEQARAEAAVDRWPQARAAVSRPRLRRWLEP